MPSRDPRHSDPHETSRSRALQQSRRADAWWFAWLRRAELLRGCCAKWLGTGVDATPRSLARMVIGGSGFGWAMTVTVALARDTMLGPGVARALATTPPQALVAPEVRDALGEADLVVLNLECCISERGRPWDAPGKPFFFRAPPRAVELLALLGTDCVTLANNHALDSGVAAAGRLVLADPSAAVANRDTGLSRGPNKSSCGASGSSARARLRRRHPRAGARPAQDHPLTPFFQPAYIFRVQPGRAPAAPPPVPMRGSSVRRVRHGALSGRRGRFATRSGW
jgi:hypothetical protein